MRIIISPAKRMKEVPCAIEECTVPQFYEESLVLRQRLRSLPAEELRKVLNCSAQQFPEEQERVFRTCSETTPALLAYDGMQYRQIAADTLTEEEKQYLNSHLRILSGLYGLLRPMDGISCYRLEMKAGSPSFPSLYRFWDNRLAEALLKETDTIVDLASKEYEKAVLPGLSGNCRLLRVEFETKGSWGKILRGRMVRFAAEHQVEDPEELKRFTSEGYAYSPSDSTDTTWVFKKLSRTC